MKTACHAYLHIICCQPILLFSREACVILSDFCRASLFALLRPPAWSSSGQDGGSISRCSFHSATESNLSCYQDRYKPQQPEQSPSSSSSSSPPPPAKAAAVVAHQQYQGSRWPIIMPANANRNQTKQALQCHCQATSHVQACFSFFIQTRRMWIKVQCDIIHYAILSSLPAKANPIRRGTRPQKLSRTLQDPRAGCFDFSPRQIPARQRNGQRCCRPSRNGQKPKGKS